MYQKSPSKVWRKKNNKYKLTGSQFKKNGTAYYPPRDVEPGSTDMTAEDYEFKNEAKLVTWSVVHVAPSGFDKHVPYAVGILELENGQRFTAQIVDLNFDELQKGDVLYPTFRKFFESSDSDVIHYGLKWTK